MDALRHSWPKRHCPFSRSRLAFWLQDNAALRIGTFAVENGLQPFYARDNGFFTSAGINADVQLLPGSAAIAAGIVSDAIDVG